MTNADQILFRPSSLGDIMSGTGKGWAVKDSLTCKRKLISIYREIKYGRYYTHTNKYTEKGVKMEEDGITLYARVRKINLVKNSKRITSDFFSGEPDIVLPKETIDIKCSWSLDTFPHPLTDKPDPAYEYQGLGYMDLTGSEKHTIAYCLVNAPANLVIKAKEHLWYNMSCPDDSDQEYMRERINIEKNMIFDAVQFKKDNPAYDFDCKEWVFDIPKEERVVEFVIERDEKKIIALKDRITEARDWINVNLFKLQLEVAL